MKKQIVTISREYGSGGRTIGNRLAKAMGVPYYERQLLDKIARESGFTRKLIEEDESKSKRGFLYALSMAFSANSGTNSEYLSANEQFFMAQFDYIRKMAAEEESFVIVGRCADYILRDMPDVTNVFIYAGEEDKLKRAMTVYGLTEEDARKIMANMDKTRANYYNYHTGQVWGDYHNYDLSINSSKISEDGAVQLILDYIELRS
jgi:Cytidylate kinase